MAQKKAQGVSPPAVAVIADAHVHDTYASYGGTPFLLNGMPRTLRNWADTRSGARVFNESEAALTAALKEVCARGIRHVVLLGDYTDDGQILATESLAARLHGWQDRAGLNFYALPGNHDIFGPLGKHNATRFVTAPGQTQLVTSDPDLAATEPMAARLSPQMYCAGQPDGLAPMAEFGLFRQPHYLHWESPFGPDDRPAARMFTATSPDGQIQHRLMDASYLVEPVDGLWLLMIDANVFEPRNGRHDPSRKKAFGDPSFAGWNALLRVKPFLIDWIGDICSRAERAGKTLLAFSHYPVLDPFEDHIGAEVAMFGATTVVRRTPDPVVAQRLIRAGLRQHFSGHMHVHSVTYHQTATGSLSNVAVPSLVAFPPAFAIATAQSGPAKVETVSLASQPLDPQLMEFYRSEAVLQGTPDLSNTALKSQTYGDFLYAQMQARSRQRMVKHWPSDIAHVITTATAADLACMMLDPSDHARLRDNSPHATALCASRAAAHGLSFADLAATPLDTLSADWYGLRQAGPLMAPHLSAERLSILRFLTTLPSPLHTATDCTQRRFFAMFLLVLRSSLNRLSQV